MNASIPYHPLATALERSSISQKLKLVIADNQLVAYAIGCFYVASIFWIQSYMKNRKSFRLKLFSIMWNLFLTIVNTIGFFRILVHLMFVIQKEGLHTGICHDRIFTEDTVSFFWSVLFPFIKILELGDTILIVLQKRYLANFYWIHHFFALIVTWYVFPMYVTVGEWLGFLIYFNHIPIYVLATIKSFGIKLSRKYSIGLMISEVGHMACGLVLCLTIFRYMYKKEYCDVSFVNNFILLFVYFICFILSSSLLYSRYLKPSPKQLNTVQMPTEKSMVV